MPAPPKYSNEDLSIAASVYVFTSDKMKQLKDRAPYLTRAEFLEFFVLLRVFFVKKLAIPRVAGLEAGFAEPAEGWRDYAAYFQNKGSVFLS